MRPAQINSSARKMHRSRPEQKGGKWEKSGEPRAASRDPESTLNSQTGNGRAQLLALACGTSTFEPSAIAP
jgi:hypothetical protein